MWINPLSCYILITFCTGLYYVVMQFFIYKETSKGQDFVPSFFDFLEVDSERLVEIRTPTVTTTRSTSTESPRNEPQEFRYCLLQCGVAVELESLQECNTHTELVLANLHSPYNMPNISDSVTVHGEVNETSIQGDQNALRHHVATVYIDNVVI